jgi:hypothetical protein
VILKLNASLLAVLVCLFWHSPASAKTKKWGIGAVSGESTGMSLSYRKTRRSGFHITGMIESHDSLSFQVDMQRFFRPWFLIKHKAELYSGLGLHGKALKTNTYEEEYRLAIPVGLEWQWRRFPMRFFGEGAAMVGPLPLTHIYGRFHFGVRAMF